MTEELLAEISLIQEKLKKAEAERNAALADLEKLRTEPYSTFCDICKHFSKGEPCDSCMASAEIDFPAYEWRGVQNE